MEIVFNVVIIIIIIIIRHKLGLERLVPAPPIVFSKVTQVVIVRMVYNSASVLASIFFCPFLLHVVAYLICTFLFSRQLVLLSTLPKFLT